MGEWFVLCTLRGWGEGLYAEREWGVDVGRITLLSLMADEKDPSIVVRPLRRPSSR